MSTSPFASLPHVAVAADAAVMLAGVTDMVFLNELVRNIMDVLIIQEPDVSMKMFYALSRAESEHNSQLFTE